MISNEESLIPEFKTITNVLSSKIFEDAPVEIHICNEHLETIKVIL